MLRARKSKKRGILVDSRGVEVERFVLLLNIGIDWWFLIGKKDKDGLTRELSEVHNWEV